MDKHKDALICDLAEYYGILNYRDFDAFTLATFACGLRPESRTGSVRTHIVAQPVNGITLIQILDALNNIAWSIGGGEKDPPDALLKHYYDAPKETVGYKDGASYDRARAEILERIKRNG